MLKDELKDEEYTGWFVHKKDHRTKDELHSNLPKITDTLKFKSGGGGGGLPRILDRGVPQRFVNPNPI